MAELMIRSVLHLGAIAIVLCNWLQKDLTVQKRAKIICIERSKVIGA